MTTPFGGEDGDRPDWMSDSPVSTHSQPRRPLTADERARIVEQAPAMFRAGASLPAVRVDVDALARFGTDVAAELEHNVAPNVSGVLTRLCGPMGTEQARTFGTDARMGWPKDIGNYHVQCEQRAEILINDLQRGLHLLATAATALAADFQAVDDANAVDVARVQGMFTPPEGPSLADEIERRAGG